jgi:hypothetical protein
VIGWALPGSVNVPAGTHSAEVMVACGTRAFASCAQGQSAGVIDWAMDIADSRLNAAAMENAIYGGNDAANVCKGKNNLLVMGIGKLRLYYKN